MKTKEWKVNFAYLLDKNQISPSENFNIKATVNDILFQGHAQDEDFEKLANCQPEIEGVFEDEFIRFTKNYPYFFGSDEKGELIIDKKSPGHSVVYEGEWNQKTNKYEGDWFIEWKDVDGEIYHITGPWEMEENK